MREFVHFTLVRAGCAVFSYAVYLVMLVWLDYEVAYVGSYVAGIGLAYLASARLVFGEPLRRKAALIFPVVYLVQFFLGFLLIRLAVEVLAVPEWLALGVSVAVTLPLTFVMSRWAVRIT